jgi:hypothetical protein
VQLIRQGPVNGNGNGFGNGLKVPGQLQDQDPDMFSFFRSADMALCQIFLQVIDI